MEKLAVEGNRVLNLPGFSGGEARIAECQTPEQFAAWHDGADVNGESTLACRYEDCVYVKTPKTLNADGEFSLDYDCLPIEEANARIEQWNSAS